MNQESHTESPAPDRSQGDWTPHDESLSPVRRSEGYDAEARYRKRLGESGIRDVEFSAAAVVLFSFAQVLRDSLPNPASLPQDSSSILETMARMPVGWKAWSSVAAAYAVKSGAVRMIHSQRLREDVETQETDGLLRREKLTIATRKERRRQHIRQRLGRGAVTAVAGVLVYKTAEHASDLYTMTMNMGSMAAALAGAHYARRRARKYAARLDDVRDSNLDYGVFYDPHD